MTDNRLKVVMTTEGTYPYYTGGVSTWADTLIKGMDDVDFYILPILMHPYISMKFDIPLNVIDVLPIPLWGTEEPNEFISNIAFYKTYMKKVKTYDSATEDKFIKIIETVVMSIYDDNADLGMLGETLLEFHEYFKRFDYHTTFRSQRVWYLFYDMMLHVYKGRSNSPAIYNFVESLRWLYRFFISLLTPVIEADIYHSSAAAFCGLPCIVAKLMKGSKFILTEHGIYVREQYLYASREKMPEFTKDFLMHLVSTISRLNYYFADQISPVCEYNKRWEVKFGAPAEKIKVIYNGIDLNKFRKTDVEANLNPTIVMVARIDPLKDIETFIRTCDAVLKKRDNVVFKLYGPVNSEKYYTKCMELVDALGIKNNFIFAGKTSSPELANNEGDVVLLTSISEAFPFSVIEAMACEKVVISSDVGGTKEVLEGYGYIVKPRDYEAFADAIIHVLDNPAEAAEIGIDARQRVLRGFTIQDMVNNYRNAYYSLVDAEVPIS